MKSAISASVILAVVICFAACDSFNQSSVQGEKFINPSALDSSMKPGDNFFLFANGKWADTIKIPSTEMGTGSFF